VLEPGLHGERAGRGVLGAAAREVVAVAVDRQVVELVRRVALHGTEGLREGGERRTGSDQAKRAEDGGDQDAHQPVIGARRLRFSLNAIGALAYLRWGRSVAPSSLSRDR
jgi:hypothetical protein